MRGRYVVGEVVKGSQVAGGRVNMSASGVLMDDVQHVKGVVMEIK